MVVRFALGLSAEGGIVTVFAADSFYGWVTLACARHLMNAGTDALAVLTADNHQSPECQALLPALLHRGADVVLWPDGELPAVVNEVIEGSHNVICGLADGPSAITHQRTSFTSMLNESHVPVHVVGCPIGPDLGTEQMTQAPLYASSTLSLGLPLRALNVNPDLVGRHYLCDLSLALGSYRQFGYDGPPLFAEQPVVKIEPNMES
jgi:hypothetical protein